MAESNGTDLLRRAAELMRERATIAQVLPAPWSVDDLTPSAVYVISAEEDVVAGRFRGSAAVGVGRHIASWHPAVALAVADWLDGCASRHSHPGGPRGGDEFSAAGAVARAYLGEPRS